MNLKSAVLVLLFSCITAIATLPTVALAENANEGRLGRRGQDISQQTASDDIKRARTDRMRARGGESKRPVINEDIDPAQTSDDPTYGYTKENPVKVGGETLEAGVAASYVYLKQLRDKNRKPFKYNRVGNVGEGPDGHITDFYKLTDSEGAEFSVYIDAYHPEKNALDCKAPKGMFIAQ